MKHLPFAFSMLALACAVAAAWRPEHVWPLAINAFVFLVASAGVAGAQQARK